MFKKALMPIFLILFVVNTCGCVALLAGAAGAGGTAVWLKGKIIQEVDASFDRTIKTVKSALKSLKLEVTKEIKKTDVAQIMSAYNDGKTIWIDVHKVSESKSRVEVRVGVMGDEEAAQRILGKINRYL